MPPFSCPEQPLSLSVPTTSFTLEDTKDTECPAPSQEMTQRQLFGEDKLRKGAQA